jgi:hypothetical protein
MFFNTIAGAATYAANDNGLTHYLGGGTYNLAAFGTFGSGTFKLQRLLADGTTYLDVSGASFTANGQATLQLPAGMYRMNLTAATGPSLKAQIQLLSL